MLRRPRAACWARSRATRSARWSSSNRRSAIAHAYPDGGPRLLADGGPHRDPGRPADRRFRAGPPAGAPAGAGRALRRGGRRGHVRPLVPRLDPRRGPRADAPTTGAARSTSAPPPPRPSARSRCRTCRTGERGRSGSRAAQPAEPGQRRADAHQSARHLGRVARADRGGRTPRAGRAADAPASGLPGRLGRVRRHAWRRRSAAASMRTPDATRSPSNGAARRVKPAVLQALEAAADAPRRTS